MRPQAMPAANKAETQRPKKNKKNKNKNKKNY